MRPTHRHADGGVYEYVEPCPIKHPVSGEWVEGVAYRGDDGKLRATTAQRWADRFEPIELCELEERKVEVMDEEDQVIASFVFRVEEAGDIRYMLITPGYFERNMQPIQQHYLSTVLRAQADMMTKGLHLRDHDFPDMIGDVNAFHAKFGQEYTGKPRMLPTDLFDFRVKFHDEETSEYRDEQLNLVEAIRRKDRRDIINALELQLDSLVDAAWVILGTADLQFGRAAFIEAWRRVVRANMAKVRKVDTSDGDGSIDSGRAPKYDIVKPAGWVAPDHRDLVSDNAIFDEVFNEPAVDEVMTAQEVQA
jgi:predicted HAD superfamily Cof-like phosphohydrolase